MGKVKDSNIDFAQYILKLQDWSLGRMGMKLCFIRKTDMEKAALLRTA